MKNILRLLLLLPGYLYCSGCGDASGSLPVSSATDSTDFTRLVRNWNDVHASKDMVRLSNAYNDSVVYYGQGQDKNACMAAKLNVFKAHPDYTQIITGSIQTKRVQAGEFKCSFIKRVIFDNKTREFPSYLVFAQKDGIWKIINEGDQITDKNLAKLAGIPKNAIKGDFNGDGKTEYAWLVPPKLIDSLEDCDGPCTSIIRFSDTALASIEVPNCIGGLPTNLGDLDKDNQDEIGLVPDWFTSCWRSYNVFTLKNGQWILAVKPFSIYQCDELLDYGPQVVQVDSAKEGHVLIHYSDMGAENISVKTKSVPVK